ncbi:MAG: LacI family DNA-binding transcriptional regulator [Nitriliruptoraceae bacterium]
MTTKPPPTLANIAAEAGVSLATASRVLSGSSDRVSEALAARVRAAAQALHYVPNAHAQALARASSNSIGLIVHDVSDPYFAEIARGVLRAASLQDRLVMICNSWLDTEREVEYVRALRSQRVHSILLAGSGHTDPDVEARLADELHAFRAEGGHAASVGRHALGIDMVQPDNVGGARLAACHLLEQGHERFGVLAGPASLTTIEDRLHGFRTEIERSGGSVPEEHVCYGDFTRSGGYEAASRLLERAPEVTGVFSLNDAMAVGALAAFRDHGVDVPSEVSLVGFDDISLAADVHPPLTTVHVPMEELGRRVTELAVGAAAVDGDGPAVVEVPSEFVVRASTAPPRPKIR